MRKCITCLKEKPVTEYYRHKLAKDGLFGECKECVRARARENRRKKLAYYRNYDLERQKTPERKDHKMRMQRRSNLLFPEKRKARHAVNNAIRDGRFERQPCEICGEFGEAHHSDYSNPFAVRFLCVKHHRILYHGMIDDAESA